MALPKLNDTPKYQMVVPSSGKTVSYRPFLVKEEKVLLMALESENPQQIATAMFDTVTHCVYDELKPKELTNYDVEFMFLNIRSKAVGETSKIVLKCEKCEHENEITVNIPDIKIDVKKRDNMVKLDKNITIEMRDPAFISMAKNDKFASDTITDHIIGLVQESMVAVHTEDERVDVSESSQQEVQEFLENMTGEQFAKIRTYVEGIPKLSHNIDFNCGSCSHENKVTVEGLQNFL